MLAARLLTVNLFTFAHHLKSVHTWTVFFLRHLKNMSSMVPIWASTGSGFVPIWGPRPKPCRSEEVVYSLTDSCSHFTQRLFPPKLSQQHTQIISYSTFNIIHTIPFKHHIYAHIYIFYWHVLFTLSLLWIFMAGWLPSVPCVRYKYYNSNIVPIASRHIIVTLGILL